MFTRRNEFWSQIILEIKLWFTKLLAMGDNSQLTAPSCVFYILWMRLIFLMELMLDWSNVMNLSTTFSLVSSTWHIDKCLTIFAHKEEKLICWICQLLWFKYPTMVNFKLLIWYNSKNSWENCVQYSFRSCWYLTVVNLWDTQQIALNNTKNPPTSKCI